MSPFPIKKALLAAPFVTSFLFSKDTDAATCTTNQRKSWTAFASQEKKDYINAELCLISAPPKLGIRNVRSRFEELQWVHLAQLDYIHGVGAFLPWHRYFVTTHERLLQNECNYVGAQPYWDEMEDQGSLSRSEIFDPSTGFGGNGYGDDGCVSDGPFANLTLQLNGDHTTRSYCLSRNFDNSAFSGGGQSFVDSCHATGDFVSAWPCYEGYPHDAGHNGVGGVMGNVAISAGDPLFYMHHAYLDKLFWEWQQATPAGLSQVGGTNVEAGMDPTEQLYPVSAFTNYNGDDGNVTTMNHVLWMAEILPNVTIGDVMDITGQTICAEYV